MRRISPATPTGGLAALAAGAVLAVSVTLAGCGAGPHLSALTGAQRSELLDRVDAAVAAAARHDPGAARSDLAQMADDVRTLRRSGSLSAALSDRLLGQIAAAEAPSPSQLRATGQTGAPLSVGTTVAPASHPAAPAPAPVAPGPPAHPAHPAHAGRAGNHHGVPGGGGGGGDGSDVAGPAVFTPPGHHGGPGKEKHAGKGHGGGRHGDRRPAPAGPAAPAGGTSTAALAGGAGSAPTTDSPATSAGTSTSPSATSTSTSTSTSSSTSSSTTSDSGTTTTGQPEGD